MRLLHEYENLIVIGYENVISRNIMGGIFRPTQQQNRREDSYVISYAASTIQLHVEIKRSIWTCFYDSVHSICDCLHHSW